MPDLTGREGAILQAVGLAAERLLSAVDWRAAMDLVLQALGQATDASRAHIYSVRPGDDEEMFCSLINEWVAEGVIPQIENPREQDFPLVAGGYGRWIGVLGSGNLIQGVRSEFPDREREFLDSEGILSVLVVPVFVEGKWWGWIGFDDTHSERHWEQAETDALRTAAGTLGASIQRERMEKQRLNAEAKYRALVEQLPSITYIASADPDNATLYISPQVQDLLGYSPADWIKTRGLWVKLLHPEDLERVLAETTAHTGSGEPLSIEYRMRSRWGKELWIHEEAALVHGDDGNPLYWQGVMLDVTERKQAEEAAHEAETRHRSLIESIPAIVYTSDVDPANTTLYISPRVEELLGYSPEQWMTDVELWGRCIHPDDRDRVFADAEIYNASGEPYEGQYRLRASDGSWHWIHEQSIMVRDEAAKPLYWQGVMMDITDRHEAESKVREAESRYRSLIETIPAIVYVSASDEPVATLYVSPQVEQLLGYSPEEWMSDPDFWSGLLHSDDREEAIARSREHIASGDPYSDEYRLQAKDGGWHWIREQSLLVRDEEGQPLYWQGVLFDVTDAHEAEERTRAAEEKYRNLVEQLPTVVYTEAVDGLLTYIGPQAEELLGVAPDEWLSNPQTWAELLHPDDRARALAADRASDGSGKPFAMEYRLVARDGRIVWVSDVAAIVRNTSGEPLYWQGLLIDITDQRAAQERLHEAEARYRVLVEHMPAIAYIDTVEHGHTLYISPQVEEFFGYTPEEWLADEDLWLKIIHPDDVEAVKAMDDQSQETLEPFSLEYRVRTKDGRELWIEDHCVTVDDEHGKPLYWHGLLFDITERRRSQELEWALQMERGTSQRLRELDETKNTFMAALSHDFRTPLAVILGLGLTMEREDMHLSEQEIRELSGRIASQARRLDRLVTDMIDLERLDQGGLELDRRSCDIASLVDRVVEESEVASTHKVHVEVGPASAQVDPVRVERIVENLLTNAAKHTRAGSEIWVRCSRDAEAVVLFVDDSGPGVPDELKPVVFEAFRRGEDASSPGHGIGLSLVKRFAELHGGRAWVTDREGGGASFGVLLPDA